jgi:hypothetical protein
MSQPPNNQQQDRKDGKALQPLPALYPCVANMKQTMSRFCNNVHAAQKFIEECASSDPPIIYAKTRHNKWKATRAFLEKKISAVQEKLILADDDLETLPTEITQLEELQGLYNDQKDGITTEDAKRIAELCTALKLDSAADAGQKKRDKKKKLNTREAKTPGLRQQRDNLQQQLDTAEAILFYLDPLAEATERVNNARQFTNKDTHMFSSRSKKHTIEIKRKQGLIAAAKNFNQFGQAAIENGHRPMEV